MNLSFITLWVLSLIGLHLGVQGWHTITGPFLFGASTVGLGGAIYIAFKGSVQ